MSVLVRVGILKVQADVREPYTGTNEGGRPYEIVSFLGDGKLYVGQQGIEAAMTGNADLVEKLTEGQDWCAVTDLNVAKFRQSNDDVFPTICNLRRGQLVRVVFETEHVIGNQRKIWRDVVASVELVAETQARSVATSARRNNSEAVGSA